MGLVPTIQPDISADQFAARMAAVFPNGWASASAKTPGGAFYAVLEMIGAELSFQNTAIQYALGATRIQTAVNEALDLAADDYFGPGGLRRGDGETDAAYRARILASLLPSGATRQAVSDAVEAVTGFVPRIIEFWRPSDTGAFDLTPGTAASFWDIDTPANPFRWTSGGSQLQISGVTGFLAYQGLIECVLPPAQPFGNNPTPCFDTNPFYWDEPNQFGLYLIDPEALVPLGIAEVYNAINRTKCEGTIAWVQFVPTPPLRTWDEPGLVWDAPGIVWS